MAIDKEHIGKDAYNAMYALITGSITDTQSPARAVSKWCYSSFPDDRGKDRSDYPIIIFNPVEFTTENFTFKKTRALLTMVIEVYMAGDKSAKYADDVTDQVVDIITDNKYSSLRNTSKLYNTEITGMTTDTVMREDLKVHIKTVSVSFDFKFTG